MRARPGRAEIITSLVPRNPYHLSRALFTNAFAISTFYVFMLSGLAPQLNAGSLFHLPDYIFLSLSCQYFFRSSLLRIFP